MYTKSCSALAKNQALTDEGSLFSMSFTSIFSNNIHYHPGYFLIVQFDMICLNEIIITVNQMARKFQDRSRNKEVLVILIGA